MAKPSTELKQSNDLKPKTLFCNFLKSNLSGYFLIMRKQVIGKVEAQNKRNAKKILAIRLKIVSTVNSVSIYRAILFCFWFVIANVSWLIALVGIARKVISGLLTVYALFTR